VEQCDKLCINVGRLDKLGRNVGQYVKLSPKGRTVGQIYYKYGTAGQIGSKMRYWVKLAPTVGQHVVIGSQSGNIRKIGP